MMRSVLAVALAGVAFAAGAYAIGQAIKSSTRQTAPGSPPAATITSETVLVPARGPTVPDLPRKPRPHKTPKATTTTSATTGPTTTGPMTTGPVTTGPVTTGPTTTTATTSP